MVSPGSPLTSLEDFIYLELDIKRDSKKMLMTTKFFGFQE